MENYYISKKELCGRSTRPSVLLEKVAQRLALNKTAYVDYNAFGNKDGVGFIPCTEKFVDNFILRVLVPDYFVEKKKYIYVGSTNKEIRDMLSIFDMGKCKVKAIAFIEAKTTPSQEGLENIPCRIPSKENPDTRFYYQDYKIACADVDYGVVLAFLRNGIYRDRGLTLKDVDVTMDYSGSFNRDEVVNSMISKHGFREEGSSDSADRTILDNGVLVGENCLTYMETVDGLTTRAKIYNKMVQMLECKGVRDTIGCHWKDWICQSGTRLSKARDAAS